MIAVTPRKPPSELPARAELMAATPEQLQAMAARCGLSVKHLQALARRPSPEAPSSLTRPEIADLFAGRRRPVRPMADVVEALRQAVRKHPELNCEALARLVGLDYGQMAELLEAQGSSPQRIRREEQLKIAGGTVFLHSRWCADMPLAALVALAPVLADLWGWETKVELDFGVPSARWSRETKEG